MKDFYHAFVSFVWFFGAFVTKGTWWLSPRQGL